MLAELEGRDRKGGGAGCPGGKGYAILMPRRRVAV